MGERIALLEFEEVRQEYSEKDAIGIPMSVREGYERTLAEIRKRIRDARRSQGGKKLGELLLEQGAISKEQLHFALEEQRRRERQELLGEVLISLGLIEKETLLSALRIQITRRITYKEG